MMRFSLVRLKTKISVLFGYHYKYNSESEEIQDLRSIYYSYNVSII